MTGNGDGIPGPRRVSRLADLAGGSVPVTAPEPEAALATPAARAVPEPGPEPEVGDEAKVTVARREFARVLGEFRRTAVLVPFDDSDSMWTADFNGVRWICAFSDEEALARFAVARGEAGREWTYRTVLGARLLDVMVPMLPGPGGVALDAGSADGALFPPVAGIVPDEVAVDLGERGTGAR
ncbi:SseB family protein [Streptomyces sp. NBC_01255]|uniref:SseB family protein n=1 Tax=Streptomyces sp. NBC_01255 TaxID=2903798 RepID=UPI002E35CC80|nr:SseB family protein [Streptomyces sp. NBC_01255]